VLVGKDDTAGEYFTIEVLMRAEAYGSIRGGLYATAAPTTASIGTCNGQLLQAATNKGQRLPFFRMSHQQASFEQSTSILILVLNSSTHGALSTRQQMRVAASW